MPMMRNAHGPLHYPDTIAVTVNPFYLSWPYHLAAPLVGAYTEHAHNLRYVVLGDFCYVPWVRYNHRARAAGLRVEVVQE